MMKKMKFIFTIIILSLILTSCFKEISIKRTSPRIGIEKTIYIGDVFYNNIYFNGTENSFGAVFNGNCGKIELTLIGVNKELIKLEYREYMKPTFVNNYGESGYKKNEPWLIKNAFTRVLEYPSDIKEINYKGQKFEIINIENASLTYKKY